MMRALVGKLRRLLGRRSRYATGGIVYVPEPGSDHIPAILDPGCCPHSPAARSRVTEMARQMRGVRYQWRDGRSLGWRDE